MKKRKKQNKCGVAWMAVIAACLTFMPAAKAARLADNYEGQSGKKIVNDGSHPIIVDVTTADGKTKEIKVPPKSAVPLPKGTTNVGWDIKMKDNMTAKSRGTQVHVAGDGKQVPLVPKSNTDTPSVTLDPKRPDVANPGVTPVNPGSDFSGQPGKTIVNNGSKPIIVDVTTADGKSQEIKVPAGSAVPVPTGATNVTWDTKMTVNHTAASSGSQVQIQGDGKQIPLTPTSPGKDSPSVVLDPKRPDVATPGTVSVGAGGSGDFVNQPGKVVVNNGDKPVEVKITTADGEKQWVTVPPGTAVPLPPGTTNVDRSLESKTNIDSRGANIQVVGDGKQTDLNPGKIGSTAGVAVNPDRPEVANPSAVPVGPGGSGDLVNTPGKMVVNNGDKPVEVKITTADGEKQWVTVPPGTAVPLPPGTTNVDRSLESKTNIDSRGANIQVVGDGKQTDLNPGKIGSTSGVAVNPDRPDVANPSAVPVGPGGSGDLVNTPGKMVVNNGDKPVEVDVTTADGKTTTITVPPGTAVPLPPDATGVDRDITSKTNTESRGANVQVVGDGKQTDLNPTKMGGTAGVAINPDRPDVANPSTVSVGPEGSEGLVNNAGKMIVNNGDKPVEVDVTTADGETKTITVPPGTAVPLPPDATGVDRDITSKTNVESKGADVQIVGDGKQADLNPGKIGGKSGVKLDPDNPDSFETQGGDKPEGEGETGEGAEPDSAAEPLPPVTPTSAMPGDSPCGWLFGWLAPSMDVPSQSSGDAFSGADNIGARGTASGPDVRGMSAPAAAGPQPAPASGGGGQCSHDN